MIERSEVNQMAKFMAAMNTSDGGSETAGSPAPADGAVAAMKTILERFHSAAENVVTDAPYDRALREALTTEATTTGARVGSWEIRVNQEGRRKQYDVINVLNGEPLASNLLLYEAAHGLVRILNEGGQINSSDAIELLRAEQDYGARVHDMVLYRHRLEQTPNHPRATVFEARYGDAKRRATVARERVCKLAEGR